MIDLTPLKEAKEPVVLCSFEKDSLVLLKHALDVRPDVQILYFYDHLSPLANRIICDWNLTVASYAPAARYQVEDTVVSEYAIGDERLPLLRDISEHGKPVGTVTTPLFDYQFDLTLFGYKKVDTHPLVNRTFPKMFPFGPTTMYAPLYDFTDADTLKAIDELGIPYEKYCDDAAPSPHLLQVSRNAFQGRFNFG